MSGVEVSWALNYLGIIVSLRPGGKEKGVIIGMESEGESVGRWSLSWRCSQNTIKARKTLSGLNRWGGPRGRKHY